jgi:hypothetical protein
MISNKLVIAVVGGLWLFCPRPVSAQSGRGWMDGFVVHESATKAAVGAKVELTALAPRSGSGKLTAKADEHGEYKFKEIPYGDYKLRVSSAGYAPYQIEIYIMPDVQTKLHVRLKKTASSD